MSGFAYVAVRSKEEALAALEEAGQEAVVLAGGTNVVPDIRSGKVRGGVLVSIGGVQELRHISADAHRIRIGPLTTIADILESDIIRREAGVLWQAARVFADPLVRNRATVAGNLGNASPAADSAVPLLVLDAVVEVERAGGSLRRVPLREFFVGPGRSVLQPGDLITCVEFSREAAQMGGCFIKLGLRRSMAISVASVAVLGKVEGGHIQEARVALGALAATPVRAGAAEAFLRGKETTPAVIQEAAHLVCEGVSPITDIRGSREYRRYVAGVLFKRAWEVAAA